MTRQTFANSTFKGVIEKVEDGSAKIKVRIKHPMQTGLSSKRHFIEDMTCLLNNQKIFAAKFYSGISTNPPVFFKVPKLEKNARLTLSWRDNAQQTETINVIVE